MPNEIAIIGDVHGCINTLKPLYKKISEHCNEIYSVGDLIDRGRYSKEVVQFSIDNSIKCVRGNHEDMLIRAVENTSRGLFRPMNEDMQLYYHNGGDTTQYSYTGSISRKSFDKFRSIIRSSGHYDWIKNLPLKYEFDGLIISHAGIIEGGDDFSIIWNRRTPAMLEKMQVFGHTPATEADYHENYFINIDTGCVYKNKLTAIIADTSTGKILEILQENYHPEDGFIV